MSVGSGPVVPKIGFKNNRCLKDYLDWVALPKVNAEDRPKAFVCVCVRGEGGGAWGGDVLVKDVNRLKI